MSTQTCRDETCEKEAHAKGLCPHHYYLANKARFKANSDRWRKENPEAYKAITRRHRLRNPEKERERHRRHSTPVSEAKRATLNSASAHAQRETAARAVRNRQTYTGWELELIADESRTVREVALSIGRTYAAVSRMRSMVRNDPATIARAGISNSGRA